MLDIEHKGINQTAAGGANHTNSYLKVLKSLYYKGEGIEVAYKSVGATGDCWILLTKNDPDTKKDLYVASAKVTANTEGTVVLKPGEGTVEPDAWFLEDLYTGNFNIYFRNNMAPIYSESSGQTVYSNKDNIVDPISITVIDETFIGKTNPLAVTARFTGMSGGNVSGTLTIPKRVYRVGDRLDFSYTGNTSNNSKKIKIAVFAENGTHHVNDKNIGWVEVDNSKDFVQDYSGYFSFKASSYSAGKYKVVVMTSEQNAISQAHDVGIVYAVIDIVILPEGAEAYRDSDKTSFYELQSSSTPVPVNSNSYTMLYRQTHGVKLIKKTGDTEEALTSGVGSEVAVLYVGIKVTYNE